MPKQKSGFTLIELMIVIIIIAILAGLAIPRFIRTAEKARGYEAIVNLRLIFAGEKMYRLDTNVYTSDLTGTGGLYLEYIEDMTAPARTKYFDFSLTATVPPEGDSFTATATRKGTGIYGSDTIIINEEEEWGGTWPDAWIPTPRIP